MVSVFYFGGEHLENLNIKEIIRSKKEELNGKQGKNIII